MSMRWAAAANNVALLFGEFGVGVNVFNIVVLLQGVKETADGGGSGRLQRGGEGRQPGDFGGGGFDAFGLDGFKPKTSHCIQKLFVDQLETVQCSLIGRRVADGHIERVQGVQQFLHQIGRSRLHELRPLPLDPLLVVVEVRREPAEAACSTIRLKASSRAFSARLV